MRKFFLSFHYHAQRTVPKNRAKQLLDGLKKEALAVQKSGSSKVAQITALNFKAEKKPFRMAPQSQSLPYNLY